MVCTRRAAQMPGDTARIAAAATALAQAEALLTARQCSEAIACFHQAQRLGADPDHCAGQRWTCYMLLGDYPRAWLQSDELRARHAPDRHRVWDGAPIQGRRVLVRSAQGFGDAVQMLRYAPLLRAAASRLTLQVAPSLAELAQMVPAVDEVTIWEEERPFDVQLGITELPYIFRSTLQTLPAETPYLHVSTSLCAEARRRLGEQPLADKTRRPRVGLVWTSSAWDPSRSVPFVLLSPLIDSAPSVDWWCLQPSTISLDWESYCTTRGRSALRAGDHSVALFAACIAEMDLLITIDSFAAHLAGALGRPAWVLLKQQADWRWLLDREDSPWYPTLRLLRQPRAGVWAEVIEQATHDLGLWLQQWR